MRCLRYLFLAFVDDLQSPSGMFAHASNFTISGGTFTHITVSHSRMRHMSSIFYFILFCTRKLSLKRRRTSLNPANQAPIHCLLDGKMCLTSLCRFLSVMLIVYYHQGALVFSGEQEEPERPKSVSSSPKKYLTGTNLNRLHIAFVST